MSGTRSLILHTAEMATVVGCFSISIPAVAAGPGEGSLAFVATITKRKSFHTLTSSFV